ncbi:MAG: tRNA 2-selenouridine(34) synthase MnmH [Ignavibacteria bacterium]|nr:tRNA 2-selenouridine(34) synthase MnmH [Ignavibacteria bacterium]
MMTSVLDDIYDPAYAVVDVRTPAEYAQGHIVGAVNIPLFTDEERAEVGTLYTQVGAQHAIDRGLEIVGPRLREYVEQARSLDKPLIVYCWRGGMRSGSMSWLLSTAGMKVRIIPRGYKGFRAHALELISRPWKYRLVIGKTGAGKTTFLYQKAAEGQQVVNLEGIANHRGSAFGRLGQQPQPTTEHALNVIHYVMHCFDIKQPVWIEDESRTVGKVHVPEVMFEAMQQSEVFELDVDIETRVRNLVRDYGAFSHDELCDALYVIREKLGGQRHHQASEFVREGRLTEAVHLILEYYDRTYEFCQQRRIRGIQQS